LRKRVDTKGEIKFASGKAGSRRNTSGIARLSNAAGADFSRPTVYTLPQNCYKFYQRLPVWRAVYRPLHGNAALRFARLPKYPV
jgi:hypothetical protein